MDFSKITARKLVQSDYKFVYGLTRISMFRIVSKHSKWSKEIFDEDFKKQRNNMKILASGKRRIGFYLIENKPDHLFVSKMYLINSYRGKGIGSYLMKKFEITTRKKRVVLDVWETNRARKFYERLGYRRIGKSGRLVVMEKILP